MLWADIAARALGSLPVGVLTILIGGPIFCVLLLSLHELDGVLALSKSGPARPIILDATDVSVYYGEKEIVHNVSIEVQSGELVAVIGPNGSGKSTMLKAFARLADKKGEVKVLGQPIESLARKMLARSIAYMPQKLQVTTPFRFMDIVLLGRYPWLPFLGNYGVKDVEIAQRCLMKLEWKASMNV